MTRKVPTKVGRSTGGHPTAVRAAEISHVVLAATIRAFAVHGTDFSMDEVATLADVSKQAIYRRWRSKTDLIIDAIDNVLSQGLIQAKLCEDDPVTALRATAWRIFDNNIAESYRINIFLQVASFREARISARLVDWRSQFLELYTQHLHDIERVNQRAEGDISVQAEILFELLSGASAVLAQAGAFSDTDKKKAFELRWQAFCRIALKNHKAV